MKIAVKLLAFVLFASGSISYFKYFRDVKGAGAAEQQQYFVVDETVWQHARADLGDLRLYAGQNEVAYALNIERGSSTNEQKEVNIVQPGTVGGKTQFFLDMSDLASYDRIHLRLKARNFVVKVQVDGQDDLHGPRWATLVNTIIYDLSDDNLGDNTTLRLPLTSYKYLRISMEGAVKPSDIEGASASVREEEKQVWENVAGTPKQEQQGKNTVFTFSVPRNVPLDQLEFSIDAAQANFRREVELQNEKKMSLRSGEISRVHMVRHGQKIDSEQTNLDLDGMTPETLKVIIHNGDDPPLKITGVRLQQYQRRIYFNSASAPRVYYGDEKLYAPEYDYAKLFQKDARAAQAELGPEQSNTAYTGRPDERPWSERHPAVLWIAIIAAVVILGAMALRSFSNISKPPQAGERSL
jgi:Protein of unknown function (DUF3999)